MFYQISVLQILSPSLWLVFHSLNSIIQGTKNFNCNEVQFISIFLFYLELFIQEIKPNLKSKDYLLCFLLELFFIVLDFISELTPAGMQGVFGEFCFVGLLMSNYSSIISWEKKVLFLLNCLFTFV